MVLVGIDVEHPANPTQGYGRVDVRLERAERNQVSFLGQPVRHGQRHGRLANPTDPHEADESLSVLEPREHVADKLVASDEEVGQCGDRWDSRLGRGGLRSRCCRSVRQGVVQDLGLHLSKRRSGVDPQLLEQYVASAVAGLEGAVLLAAPIVGGGQCNPAPLVKGMLGEQRRGRLNGREGVARAQLHLSEVSEGGATGAFQQRARCQ